MLKKLYDFTLQLAEHPKAIWALFFIAIIESIIFPIPPDVMLIAMVLAVPAMAWRYAAVCTIGSVIGAVIAYMIGRHFFDDIADPMFHTVCNYSDKYCPEIFLPILRTKFEEWGVWLVAVGSTSIIPYKLITVTAGVAEMNLTAFIVTSIFGRGLRFFLVAGLLKHYGKPVKHFIEKHLVWVFTLCCALVTLFIVFRYVL